MSASPTEGSPSVLWICTDQHRFDTLGCAGADFIDTPHIDALAADGVRFDRAYCQAPVCTPSRASFLTGRYPSATNVRTNGQPIPRSERLVTAMLAEEGYHCGLAGKLHISPTNAPEEYPPHTNEPARRIEDGYGTFRWAPAHYMDVPGNEYRAWLRDRGLDYDQDPHSDTEHVSIGPDADHQHTTWCADRAIDFLRHRSDADAPWLFSLNFLDPHHPWDPAPAYLDKYEQRLDDLPTPNYEPGELDDKPTIQRLNTEPEFAGMDEHDHRMRWAATCAMVDLIDDQVGRILETLDATGQRDDTIVVFMADHGELHGDHGNYRKGPYFYEPSVRVPLLFSGPGIESGVETDALVELLDIAPTLLSAADIDPPLGMQGQSLWPVLAGDRDDHRADVYCSHLAAQSPHELDSPRLHSMLRTPQYKLVRHHGTDEGELYDLDADPKETHNRFEDPEYHDVRLELTTRMTDRMAATADPEPENTGRW